MAIQSTGRLRAWRPFRGAIAVGVAGTALLAACSGSSSNAGRARPTGGRPTSAPTVPGSVPRGTTPPGRGAHVVFVPRSIDPTGRREVHNALQGFIASVPNGTTIEFPAGARYRIERTLYIRNRRRLTFDGNGATIFATQRGARDRSQIWVKRGAKIVFRDLTLRGVNPNGGVSEGAYVAKLETQHGFRFEGTQGAELDHVHVTDVYGDFVYVGPDKHKRSPRDVWIHDSTFARNGRQGISVVGGEDVIIERNHFSDTRRATIDLEPNGRHELVSNVFILHNTVGKGRLLFVASHGRGPVDNIVISGNVLHGHDLTIDSLPPEGQRRANWVVTDNVSDTVVHHRPMRFFGTDGVLVQGNTQLVSGGDPGVVLTDDCGARVAGNRFGSAGVVRHGRPCGAALAVPHVPALPGRGRVPTHPGGATQPGHARSSGSSDAGWILVVVALGVAAAVLVAVVVRRRRRSN